MHVLTLKSVLRAALAVTLAAAGVVAVTTGTAGAAGAPCQRTYGSGVLDYPIPDTGSSTGSLIDVPEDGLVVTDVDVTVNIHHPNVSDLTIAVASGTDAYQLRGLSGLFGQRGGTGDNLLGTVFDDAAGTPISAGVAPFTGRYRPESPLSTFNGFAGGVYQLVVTDGVHPGNAGILNDWSLTIRYASCDLDTDSVEDHVDSCLGVSAHTATGCPLTTGKVGASYRHGRFKGAVSSPVAGCKAGRAVTVWQARPGPDRRVGTATSHADGSYRLARKKHRGRFYATSTRVAVTDVAECPAVRSARFRIR